MNNLKLHLNIKDIENLNKIKKYYRINNSTLFKIALKFIYIKHNHSFTNNNALTIDSKDTTKIIKVSCGKKEIERIKYLKKFFLHKSINETAQLILIEFFHDYTNPQNKTIIKEFIRIEKYTKDKLRDSK